MVWTDRIKPGAYKAPSGTRIEFQFVEVSRETEKRTAEFQFNGLNGAYIQDNGYGPRKYPLRCIFSGADHDITATRFEIACLETGIGELEHPFYGTFPAIPTGTVARRNDLVGGNNQSIVEVTFSTSLARVYPAGQSFPKSEIANSLEGFNEAATQQFADSAQLDTVARRAEFKNTITDVLGTIRSSFEKAQGFTAEARRDIADRHRLINEALDVLVGSPLLLAQAVSNLVLAPARFSLGLKARLDGYGRMLQGIIDAYSSTSGDSSSLPETVISKKNQFQLVDLVSMTSVAGSVLSSTDNTAATSTSSGGPSSSGSSSSSSSSSTGYQTRPEALQAADTILEQFETTVTFRDERTASLGIIDTGTSYQPLQEAVALAAGYLVETSFALVPERILVLDRDRTLLDVCGQLYGTTSDERLDFLISSNDLSGNQILELKRGDSIRYYV